MIIVCSLFFPFNIYIYVLFFISDRFQGNIALEKSKQKKPFAWIPELGWEDAVRLSEISPRTFGHLLEDIEQNEDKWRKVSLTHFPSVVIFVSRTLKLTKLSNASGLLSIYLVGAACAQ